MLVRFSAENFLSFKDPVEFSMIAGKVRKHSDHVVTVHDRRLLKGSYLFGANGAGKSNLIKGIEFASNIVLHGLHNMDCENKHFRIDRSFKNKPGVFQFDFFENGKFYSYGFGIRYPDSSIIEEWLYETGDHDLCIFHRQESEDGSSLEIRTDLEFDGARFEIYREDFSSPKQKRNLFLSDVARRVPDHDKEFQPFRDAYNWFSKLMIVFPDSRYRGIVQLSDSTAQTTGLTELLSCFDTGISSVVKSDVDFESLFNASSDPEAERQKNLIKSDLMSRLEEEPESTRIHLAIRNSLIEIRLKNGKLTARKICTTHGRSDEMFEFKDESEGTRKLFDLFPIYQAALAGRIILVDELDRSLHTKAVESFIRNFYVITSGINTQLIATAHASNILDLNLLRQDEIWFAERGIHCDSKVYSLNKFNERFDKRIEKEYLDGRYGAVPVFTFPDRSPEIDQDESSRKDRAAD